MSIVYLIGALVLAGNILIGILCGITWILVKIFKTDEDNTIALVVNVFIFGGMGLAFFLNAQGII